MISSAYGGFIDQAIIYTRDNFGNSLSKYILIEDGEVSYNRGFSKSRPYGSTYCYHGSPSLIPFVYHTFKVENHNSDFIAHYLNSGVLDRQLKKIISSTARMDGLLNIESKAFYELSLNVPPTRFEENKVISLLLNIDKRIVLQRKTIEDYKQTLRSLINHLTKDGVIFRFKNLYLKAKEGGTPDTKKNQYYINGTIPFVKIKDLDRKYLNKTESFINNDGLSNSSAWLIPSNSILLSNGATIGRVSINAIPVSTKQGILGIIPNKSVILTDYFYYLLKSSYFQKEIRRITTKGTMDAAYISDIDDIDLFVPDLNVQRKRAKVLSFVNQKINIEESKLNILNNLKTYLLANLFI